jgi:amylosucrase
VKLFNLRKQLPALYNSGMEVVDTGNTHLFGYLRSHADQRLLIVANFADTSQTMSAHLLGPWGGNGEALDHLTGETISLAEDLVIEHHRAVWLELKAT